MRRSDFDRFYFLRRQTKANRRDGRGSLVVVTVVDTMGSVPQDRGAKMIVTADALTAFDQAAANRQQALDYRGMARALAQAGDACVRLDRTGEAANYFLRAGRSALLQGDAAMALPLLKRADELASRSGQTGIVDEVARLRREAAARTAAR